MRLSKWHIIGIKIIGGVSLLYLADYSKNINIPELLGVVFGIFGVILIISTLIDLFRK